MKYDKILVLLYVLVLAVILIKLFSMVALTVVIILLMLMVVIQKTCLEKMVKTLESEKNSKLDEIFVKIEDVSKRMDNFKDETNRQLLLVDGRVSEVRALVASEVEGIYREVSRNVMGVEGRLNELRQNLAAAVGSLDERIQVVERQKEEESL